MGLLAGVALVALAAELPSGDEQVKLVKTSPGGYEAFVSEGSMALTGDSEVVAY